MQDTHNQEMKRRIAATLYDTYPLDKMLPLNTVYQQFLETYKAISEKSVFVTDSKYQKFREGFFTLFVAAYMQTISSKEQFICFPPSPSDPSGDARICFIHDLNKPFPEFHGSNYDVKEFTEYEESFQQFVDQTIKPKIGRYNLIIGIYEEVSHNDLLLLTQALEEKDSEAKIFVVGASPDAEGNQSVGKGNVVVMDRTGCFDSTMINLDQIIKPEPDGTLRIYQDQIRLK